MTRRYLIIAAFVPVGLLTALPSARAGDGDGGYAGAFFQIPVGARPTALGGAYVAVSDDGAAPLFNPAGLADLRRPLFGSSFRYLALDRRMGYVTVMFPARGRSAIGVNWLYAGSGEVDGRDSNGRLTGQSFGMRNHAFSALFAKRFQDYLSVGMSAGYLHSSFAEMISYSVNIDLGVIVNLDQLVSRERRDLLPVQDMRLGLVVKHLAAEYRWDNDKYLRAFGAGGGLSTEQDDKVPIEVGIGLSSRFVDRKLLAALDLRKNEEQNLQLHAGAEFILATQLALRSGYSDRRFTAGTGYFFEINKLLLAIDYAFATGRVGEGSEHIFSFDFLF